MSPGVPCAKFPSTFGSRVIHYVRDRQTDGRTKATLNAPYHTGGGITIPLCVLSCLLNEYVIMLWLCYGQKAPETTSVMMFISVVRLRCSCLLEFLSRCRVNRPRSPLFDIGSGKSPRRNELLEAFVAFPYPSWLYDV